MKEFNIVSHIQNTAGLIIPNLNVARFLLNVLDIYFAADNYPVEHILPFAKLLRCFINLPMEKTSSHCNIWRTVALFVFFVP